MTTKSEDIRLSINNVKHKKGEGTLYLMAERLGWMPNSKNEFTISHKYSDIKMQKISPEGKAKIQLQIVLHTGDNTTFQFTNLEDRTAVKDSLLIILPQFKGKIPKDREKKAQILSKNPNLLQLYKDLVESKIISADEFWTQFVDDRALELVSQDTVVEHQDEGVSADFLSGIPLNAKPSRIDVSVQTLYAILKTYPRIAKKHQELVPTKMSEREFWNKFFQSRYFNRDRTKDLFSDCARSDDKELTSAVKKGQIDPFCDLDMFVDNTYQNTANEPPPITTSENSDQFMIRRFNQQSIRLLESLQANKKPHQQSTSATKPSNDSQADSDVMIVDAPPPADGSRGDVSTNDKDGSSFRANRRDWTYDDLAGKDNTGDYLDDDNRVASRLLQVARDTYTVVPQGQQTSMSSNSFSHFVEFIKNWTSSLPNCLEPHDATQALKNLSPGGLLMRTSCERIEDSVPDDLASLYQASNELLRHFWMCFPAMDSQLEKKLVSLHGTIQKFESTKLQSLYKNRVLSNHLRRQFKTASRKFEAWKAKKRERDMKSAR